MSNTAPLDEETEERIKEVCRAFNVIGLGRKEFHRQIEAQAALRSRIRQLVEEARNEHIGEMTHVDYDDD